MISKTESFDIKKESKRKDRNTPITEDSREIT